MKQRESLAQVKKGDTVVVKDIVCFGTGRQRLMDMGIIKGAQIKVKSFAPLGDPMIIEINSYEMAIRRADAKNITVS